MVLEYGTQKIEEARIVLQFVHIPTEKVFQDADDASTAVTFTWQIGEGGLHAALLDLCVKHVRPVLS